MGRAVVPGEIVDLLRENLELAGIPLDGRDLDRILEMGMLANAVAFEALERGAPADRVPDHLSDRGAAAPADAGAARADAAPPDAIPAAPDYSIAGVAARLRSRAVSPVELTERALERIAAHDRELNAFQLVLADAARAQAREAEHEIAAGRYRGPLHGVPIAIKDLLDMAGTPTTAGSRFYGERARDQDSPAVARLRAAGAIFVGKTRLAEFAYSPGSNNSTFGPTRNPHDPSRDAGGSSSGSGAAVAAGLVYGALGSDTGGSIRIPASLCGIVGLKPTYGRVSLAGAVPLAWSMDHLGPMTRTVRDAALMLGVIAGHDPGDPRTRDVPVPDYTARLESGVHGMRIGVLEADGEDQALASLESFAAWRARLGTLASAGAELVPIDMPWMSEIRIVNGALIAMEAAAFHRTMMRVRSREYGEFARLRLLSAHAYRPGAYLHAQQMRAALRTEFERAVERVDLLSTPTMPGAAPDLGIPASTRFSAPFNFLGWPAISVPAGGIPMWSLRYAVERTFIVESSGAPPVLPFGLQLVGRPWEEAQVLRAARVVEAGAGG